MGAAAMITTIITVLIYIVLLCIVMYLIIWVLEVVGVPIPAKIIQLLWVVVALIAILIIVQALLGGGLPRLGGRVEQRPLWQHANDVDRLPDLGPTPNIMVPEKR